MFPLTSSELDSGSFSLWKKAKKFAKGTGKSEWGYYDTDEFFDYLDDYAAFVKNYRKGIDLYANVDAIPNAKLTWRNQRYLERDYNLNPVPIVHFRTDLKWLKRYMSRGHEIIAVGGLVGSMGKGNGSRNWLDGVFSMVCDQPSRLPKVKIHGFGVTRHELLFRYPWWSVDNTTWVNKQRYGEIFVPRKTNGVYDFRKRPHLIRVANNSPYITRGGEHYETIGKMEQKIVIEWLDYIGMKMGDDKEEGVSNCFIMRRRAALLFFDRMQHVFLSYPHPFKICSNIRR